MVALDGAHAMRSPVLVAGTDGVGTKLKIAFMTGRHDTVGIDCVAMCVNDIICHAARPLFFLDYIATGKLKSDVALALVKGVARGCKLAGMSLVGGETAQMPGIYKTGEYDMAGFAVGIADRAAIPVPSASGRATCWSASPPTDFIPTVFRWCAEYCSNARGCRSTRTSPSWAARSPTNSCARRKFTPGSRPSCSSGFRFAGLPISPAAGCRKYAARDAGRDRGGRAARELAGAADFRSDRAVGKISRPRWIALSTMASE